MGKMGTEAVNINKENDILGGFLHLLINSLYAPECSSSEPVAEQKEHKGLCHKKHPDDPKNSPRHLWTDETKI